MNDIAKKAIRLSLIGFLLGIGVGVMIYATGGFDYLSEADKQAKLPLFMFVSGLLGVVGMGGSVVYDIESWSITKATATHFVATIAAFFAMGFIEGWYQSISIPSLLITVAMFVVAYVIIWVIQYLKCKKAIQGLNEELNLLRTKKKDSNESD